MAELNNIDAVSDEHLRTQVWSEGAYDQDDDFHPGPDIRGATLVWVTRDMAELLTSVAAGIPRDYEPRRSDFGILPENILVGFAGQTILDNVWHVKVSDGIVDWSQWPAGEDARIVSAWQLGEGVTLDDWDDGPAEGWYVLWAFLLLANEKLAHVFRDRASRRARRRHRDVEQILIVTLRRLRAATSQEESDGSVTYSHRWMVQGHWRNQWYESEQRHKPKFIAAYVKGPEDKPLIVKDRIFRVSR